MWVWAVVSLGLCLGWPTGPLARRILLEERWWHTSRAAPPARSGDRMASQALWWLPSHPPGTSGAVATRPSQTSPLLLLKLNYFHFTCMGVLLCAWCSQRSGEGVRWLGLGCKWWRATVSVLGLKLGSPGRYPRTSSPVLPLPSRSVAHLIHTCGCICQVVLGPTSAFSWVALVSCPTAKPPVSCFSSLGSCTAAPRLSQLSPSS